MDFQKSILSWYKEHKRDLPWRKTTDMYKILVSEIMLQQTQVDRVIPYYNKFLKKFPTATSLANAQPRDLLIEWSGLGYNRRAFFLQKAAWGLSKNTPQTIDELRSLPGIGHYTANAVAAFSWDKGVTAIDTNIRRIFSRYFFDGEGTIESINKKIIEETPDKGREWNNALMDVGSMICTATKPKCEQCPFNKGCEAYKNGNQDNYFRIAPPQPRFHGSKRQYRGAILKVLLKKSMNEKELLKTLKEQALKNNKKFITDVLSDLMKEHIIKKKGKEYEIV
jgi:A/G-specific adenine glycosylase